MKIYLVGGAVRDRILGVVPHDNDYVVVGASIEEMLFNGFIPVGKFFPVFKKKGCSSEFALARKEIKIGPKHTDFQFIFDSSISLEEDLVRRDFTCNAIAYDSENDELIDPFGGISDIKNKVLRHISEHFSEDPLRVVRMCRFAAQLNFEIDPSTMKLAREIVLTHQLQYISPERIWNEIQRALQYPNFHRFIEVAHECFALKSIFSAVEKFWVIKENSQKKSLAENVIECLKNVRDESDIVKFATLLCNVGKIEEIENPNFEDYEIRGAEIIKKICQSLKIPNEFQNFAIFVCRNQKKFLKIPEMHLEELLDLSEECMKKIPANFDDFFVISRELISNFENDQLDEFEKAQAKIYNIREIISNIHANDMPNFDSLKRDESFREKYREFKLNILKSRENF